MKQTAAGRRLERAARGAQVRAEARAEEASRERQKLINYAPNPRPDFADVSGKMVDYTKIQLWTTSTSQNFGTPCYKLFNHFQVKYDVGFLLFAQIKVLHQDSVGGLTTVPTVASTYPPLHFSSQEGVENNQTFGISAKIHVTDVSPDIAGVNSFDGLAPASLWWEDVGSAIVFTNYGGTTPGPSQFVQDSGTGISIPGGFNNPAMVLFSNFPTINIYLNGLQSAIVSQKPMDKHFYLHPYPFGFGNASHGISKGPITDKNVREPIWTQSF